MNRIKRKTFEERYRYLFFTSLAELGTAAVTAMYTLGSLAEEKGSTESIVASGAVSIVTGLDSFRRTKVMERMEQNPYDSIIETTGHEVVHSPRLPR